jgi:hypothetical protein
MIKNLDPMSVSPSWRVFLYDSIILPFETGTLKTRTGNFDAKAIETDVGLITVKKDKLSDLQPLEAQYKDSENEFLIFYNPEAGMKSLFERLRDVAAHGHYVQEKPNWIRVRHRFAYPGKPEATRMFGCLKFQTLKKLVNYLNRADASSGRTIDD